VVMLGGNAYRDEKGFPLWIKAFEGVAQSFGGLSLQIILKSVSVRRNSKICSVSGGGKSDVKAGGVTCCWN